MRDKNGVKLRGGDYIMFEDGFPPGRLKVRYQHLYNRGWLAERLPPHDPTPSCIDGLGHTFVVVGRHDRKPWEEDNA